MTTPNSLNSNTPPAVSLPASPPAVNPLDALAASFDVRDPRDEPAPAPAQPVPASHVPQQPTPAPSAPAGTPAPPRIPVWLSQKAEANGIPQIVVDRLDALELMEVVHQAEVRRLSEGRAAATQAAIQNPNPPGLTPTQAAAAAIAPIVNAPQNQHPAFDWGEFEDFDEFGRPTGKKVKYTDDMLNPALAHHIKRQAAEIAELKGMIGGMAQQAAASQERRFEQEFDAAFSQWPNVFGSGSAAEVRRQPNGPTFFERRKMIFGAVKGMFKAMPPEAAARMSIRDGVASMVKTMFGLDAPGAVPAAAATPPQPPAPQPDYANGHLARPTQRQPNPKPLGRERAIAAVTEWWKEHSTNGTPTEGTTTDDEFLE